ncbi:MAG: protein-L-isoaspartate(D-aspartate) O-methyltransferase [Opitutales bacterium]
MPSKFPNGLARFYRHHSDMNPAKEDMLNHHLKGRDINDPAVLRAMAEVDRTAFIPEELQALAYADRPLPIGGGQTISQPYIVAYMAQELRLGPDDTVLECGAGCGYNAAVLSRIVKQVYTVEIVPELAGNARQNLERAGIGNVEVRQGDAYMGWPEHAPFDAMILTAAPAAIPEPLKQQLRVGGRLLAPIGVEVQHLVLLTKTDDEHFVESALLPVRFVPMTGQARGSWSFNLK